MKHQPTDRSPRPRDHSLEGITISPQSLTIDRTQRLTAQAVIPQLQQELAAVEQKNSSQLITVPPTPVNEQKNHPSASGPQWVDHTASGVVYDGRSDEKSHRLRDTAATRGTEYTSVHTDESIGDEKTPLFHFTRSTNQQVGGPSQDEKNSRTAVRLELEPLKASMTRSPATYPRLFQTPTVDPKQLQTLLNHVARAQQDDVDALLKKLDPKQARTLLNAKGTVTDYSQRTFKDITAFQYALWAMDPFTWRVIMKYLPKEDARVQLEMHDKQGTAHGTYFSLERLLKAYTECLSALNAENRDISDHLWVTQVGEQQRLLPAHMLREYVTPDRPLDPIPDFVHDKPPSEPPPDVTGSLGKWSLLYDHRAPRCLGRSCALVRGADAQASTWRGLNNGLGWGGMAPMYLSLAILATPLMAMGVSVDTTTCCLGTCDMARGFTGRLWGDMTVGGYLALSRLRSQEANLFTDRAAVDQLRRARTQQLAELRSSLLGTTQPTRRTSPGNR